MSFRRVSAVSANKQLDEDLAAAHNQLTASSAESHSQNRATHTFLDQLAKKHPYICTALLISLLVTSFRATGNPQPFRQNNSGNVNFSIIQKQAEIIPVRWWKLICPENKLYLPQLRSTRVCYLQEHSQKDELTDLQALLPGTNRKGKRCTSFKLLLQKAFMCICSYSEKQTPDEKTSWARLSETWEKVTQHRSSLSQVLARLASLTEFLLWESSSPEKILFLSPSRWWIRKSLPPQTWC